MGQAPNLRFAKPTLRLRSQSPYSDQKVVVKAKWTVKGGQAPNLRFAKPTLRLRSQSPFAGPRLFRHPSSDDRPRL